MRWPAGWAIATGRCGAAGRCGHRTCTGTDLALLAIGAYEPRWFMREQHMNPAEAVQAHRDLGARLRIGIHWGTFALTDEALDQPPRDLPRARAAAGVDEAAFGVLAIGQTRWLPARQARQSAP